MTDTAAGLRRVLFRFGVITVLCVIGGFVFAGGFRGFGGSTELAARYQFDRPPAEAARQIAELAYAPSQLGRIGVTRPALAAKIIPGEDSQRVVIAPSDGSGITLTFLIKPHYDRDKSMVSLQVDTSRLGEVDLDENEDETRSRSLRRFAGPALIIEDFDDALSLLARASHEPKQAGEARRRFGRLFDLAAVLASDSLIAKVSRLGAQDGLVDFLFSDHPREPVFDESADYPQSGSYSF